MANSTGVFGEEYVCKYLQKKNKAFAVDSGNAVGDFSAQMQYTQVVRGAEVKEGAHR